MSKIVALTHNDLDGLGVVLCVESRVKIDRWFHANYHDLVLRVRQIIDYCKTNNIHKIIIGDVSFSDNKEILSLLYDYFKDGYILFCDHHEYPNGREFFKDYTNMKLVFSTSECATLQLCKAFNIQNENLKKLCQLIELYDDWHERDKNFDSAQMVNDYFWNFTGNNGSITQYERIKILADLLRDNNYKLPRDFAQVIRAVQIQTENDINYLEENHLIQRFNAKYNTTFVLSWDSFNKVILREFKNGQDMCVGIHNGIFKCRVNQRSYFSLPFLRQLRFLLCGVPDFCHPNAFTYKINIRSNEDILSEIQRILSDFNNIDRDIKECSYDDMPF